MTVPFFIPHAGCPFTCVFCNQWEISGTLNMPKPGELKSKVKEYIDTITKKHGKPDRIETAFFGGSFTGLPIDDQIAWLKEVKDLKDSGILTGIRLSTRPDYINEEILKTLLDYGVTTVELGVQSFVDEVLEKSLRGYLVSDVIKATKLIRDTELSLVYQLMLGLPGDSYDNAKRTLNTTVKLKPDGVRIYPTLVLKGTALANWYKKGNYKPWTLEMAVDVGEKWVGTFKYYDIDVIRMGLQATDNLDYKKDLIAGPYHPAYGEMVESRLYLKQIMNGLENIKGIKDLTIMFNPKEHSKIVGQKRVNIEVIKEVYELDNVYLRHDENIIRGDICLTSNDVIHWANRQEFLNEYRIKSMEP